MSDYIRREDASNWLKQYGQDVLHGKYKFSLMYIWKNIIDLPPADVVPVVHGEWERIPYSFVGGYRCSRCGQKTMENFWLYCPNCGARMIYGKRKE